MRTVVRFALLAAAFLTMAAHAETLNFTLTGPSTLITFQLTDGINYTDYPQVNELSIAPYTITDGSTSGLGSLAFDYFASGTGLDLIVGGLHGETITLNGPSLLQSGIYDPIYTPGTFSLTGHTTTTGNAPYQLVIADADPTSATPEPSTLLLLGTGTLGLLTTLRRRIRS